MSCRDCRRSPCQCPKALHAYREQLGHDPPKLPADDPLAWQWDTSMTQRERRQRLMDDLALDDEREGPPPVIDGQESLL